MTSLWRKAFDAIERPVAAGAEVWVQSDTFMDLAAVAFRVQRRLAGELQRSAEQWLEAWGMISRRELVSVMNQVASLERQVRELAHELERRESSARDEQAPVRRAA
jgi:ubiquinone biosynthesis protein UbiJ